MALPQDVIDRIKASADELHAASPTGEIPSVEAVRQHSRAGMNNVVTVMKEWRQALRKQVQTVREPLPPELQTEVQSLSLNLWDTARQMANEALESARAAYESEKADLLQLSAEQSAAFDTTAAELENAQEQAQELRKQLQEAQERYSTTAQALQTAEQAHALAAQRAEDGEKRAAELRQDLERSRHETQEAVSMAEQLRTERDKAQEREAISKAEALELRQELQTARQEGGEVRAKHAATVAKLEAAQEREAASKAEAQAQRQELIARADAAEAKHAQERDRLREDITQARESAAGLQGQLDAVQQQNKELIALLKPANAAKNGDKRG